MTAIIAPRTNVRVRNIGSIEELLVDDADAAPEDAERGTDVAGDTVDVKKPMSDVDVSAVVLKDVSC
jgi:hypothetical protein